ncbi:protein Turandot Z-like [Drosophila ficusphila]|uniref:protein Turandot Z-like n=1 Tax=Drosophila ficusphila TaxID=30025 RepID=UPI0007E76730|nr:protein Turandot Z-like [Drosophila ficusphila]
MYFVIRLSFVLAVLLCITGNGEASVLRDSSRLQEIQRESSLTDDVDTQVKLANEAIEIFNKYKGQGASDIAQEAQLTKQVNDYKDKAILIDDVPPQGGLWDEVHQDAKNLLVSSSKALVEEVRSFLVNQILSALPFGH